MFNVHRPRPEEVEHLLRNAQLRDELEPYLDESIRRVNVEELLTDILDNTPVPVLELRVAR